MDRRKILKDNAKSHSKRGSKNPRWKGEKINPGPSLHQWVGRNKPKPKMCENCGKKPPYDLANKGVYNKNFDNWEWLCRGCHMRKDGRINQLKQYAKTN